MTAFRPLSELLAAALPQGCDCPAPRTAQLRLAQFWREHLGATGAHSRPLLFASGRLVVFAESAAWGNEIRHRAPSLMNALRAGGIEARAIDVKTQPEMAADEAAPG
ncbi:MAG: DUF721 domain-containing protein [Gammaproteobacteria bacterium]